MKKITAIIIAAILITLGIFTFTGCNDEKSDKIKIVCTIFPQYDFARAIAGEYADITLLMAPGMDIHDYDPVASDMAKINSCDMFIYVGGESDSWVSDVLESVNTENKTIISLCSLTELYPEEASAGMHVESEEGEEEEYDEHVWTSPVNAILFVRKIAEELQSIDEANADAYARNAEAYISKLQSLDSDFRATVAESEKKMLVICDRFPLLYFVREYGLAYEAALPGCSSLTDVPPSALPAIISAVKDNNLKYIFKIELSNGNIAARVREATGAEILTLHSCHNLSSDDFKNGETYLSLMQKNLENLRKALS